MKTFSESSREHEMETFNFLKMKLLTKHSRNQMKMKKFIIFVQKNLKMDMLKIKSIVKLGFIVIIQVNIEKLQVAYVI